MKKYLFSIIALVIVVFPYSVRAEEFSNAIAKKESLTARRASLERQTFLKKQANLEHIFEIVKKRLATIKSNLSKNSEISHDLGLSINGKLEDFSVRLDTLSQKAHDATNTQSLKDIARNLQALRNELEERNVKKLLLIMHISIFEKNILGKAASRSAQMDHQLTLLASQGKKVADLQSQLATVNSTIASVRSELNNLAADINTATMLKNKTAETQKALAVAGKTVQGVYATLKSIAQKARSL